MGGACVHPHGEHPDKHQHQHNEYEIHSGIFKHGRNSSGNKCGYLLIINYQ
jgi:hypothetical protein